MAFQSKIGDLFAIEFTVAVRPVMEKCIGEQAPAEGK